MQSNEELKANQKKPLKVEDVKLLSDYLKTLGIDEKRKFKSPNSSMRSSLINQVDDAHTS
jgi:hypothetical protein